MGSQTTTKPAAPTSSKNNAVSAGGAGGQVGQPAPAPTGKGTQQPAQPSNNGNLSLGSGSGSQWGIGANGGMVWHGKGPEPTGMTNDQKLYDMGFMSKMPGFWKSPGVRASDEELRANWAQTSAKMGLPGTNSQQQQQTAPTAPPTYGTVPQNFGQTPSYNAPQMPGIDNSWSLPGHSGQAPGGGGFNPSGGGWGGGAPSYGGGDIPEFDRSQGDRVAQDYYDSAMMRLRPEQEKQREALDVKLRLQGLQPGTEAYNRAMQNQMTSTGDVYAKLGLDSTGMGYQTASDIYGQNLTRQNNLANQGITSQNNLANQGITSQNNLANQSLQQRNLQQQYQEQLARQGIDTRYQDIQFQNNLANQGLQGSSLGIQSQNNLAQQFAEAARQKQREQQQMFDQSYSMYQRPFEEAQFWQNQLGGGPSTNFNTFNPATSAGGLNLTAAQQAAYNAAMGQANASNNSKNNLINAGAGIAGSALGGPIGGAVAKSIFG